MAAPRAPSLRVFYGGTFDPVHAGHLAMAEAAAAALGAPVALMPAADPPHRAPPGADAGHRAAMLDLAAHGRPRLCVDRRELQREGRSYTIHTLHELRAQYGADAPLAFVIGADSLRALHTWKDWRALLDGAHLVVAERPGSALDDLVGGEPSASGRPEADRTEAEQAEAEQTAAEQARLHPPASTPIDMPSAASAQPDSALRRALAGRWAASPEELRHSAGGRVLRLRQPLHPASATEIRRRIAAGDADWTHWLAPTVADHIRRHRLYGFPGKTASGEGADTTAPDPPAGARTDRDPSSGSPAAPAV